ncbi:MAG: hypothetical protein IPL46_26155 [Saprospiraceae bacterium]|nr:hypothetical protein [Saprospiraceae bacterium]
MIEVEICEVIKRSELREFIFLPEKIHKGHVNWLPPLYVDEWIFFDRDKNRDLRDNPTILLLAYRGKEVCGRIMGIIPVQYNEMTRLRTVRFSHLEAVNDEKVVGQLLESVIAWGKKQGSNRIIGPFGFSDKDPEGLQIEGFSFPSILVTANNFEYLPPLVEKAGLRKMIDCLDYLIDLRKDIPETYPRLFERLRKKLPVHLVEPKNKKELRKYIHSIFELINKSYQNIYGFIPLSDEEILGLVSRYLPILDVRFIKIVVDQENSVKGVIIAIPHLTQGIIKSRGRLFPLGFVHLLRAARKTKQLDLMIGAVAEDMRRRGVDLLMGWALIESAVKAGMHTMETPWCWKRTPPCEQNMNVSEPG